MNTWGSTFESPDKRLQELLDDIRKGKIQLPDFQRDWIWDDDHIRSLLASVAQAYPIGAIMLLQTGGQSVRFAPRPIEGAPAVGDPECLILDGQQRLTALYQSLYSGQAVDTRDPRKKPIKRWYFIDMKKALARNGDFEEAIISLPEDLRTRNFRGEVLEDYSRPEDQYHEHFFPLSKVFAYFEWRQGFNNFWNYGGAYSKFMDDFEARVLQRFMLYQIPVIVLLKDTPKEAVCQVFEKVNTGGVSLTVFELLTASFAADNFNLRNDWAQRVGRLRKYAVLAGLQNTDFLQAIALLVTYTRRNDELRNGKSEAEAPGISCKRKDILRLDVDEYMQWANRVEEGFVRAARFLHRQHIFTSRDLPYNTQAVPLAAILTILGQDAEKDGMQRGLESWYWCGVLGELYGSAVESRFARDLPEVVHWVLHRGPVPKTIEDANFVRERLYTLRTRNSAAYKGIHALLMRDGCLDLQTGFGIEAQMYFDDKIDIHHIFPRDWCDHYGVNRDRCDCIVNKTPIAAKTNRSIGGNAPSRYLAALERSAGISSERMDDILCTHLIDSEAIRSDDFEAFFTTREQALLQRIGQAMGKPIVQGAVPDYGIDEDYEGTEAVEEILA